MMLEINPEGVIEIPREELIKRFIASFSRKPRRGVMIIEPYDVRNKPRRGDRNTTGRINHTTQTSIFHHIPLQIFLKIPDILL